ncbi:MFS transporter [Micromonospora echinofusca]|uniref:MFS transporter n=1 Tax=Micromonospora echinofusca TaxID=47858 RepID=UPI0027DD5C6D|nr:MFS transporter [Micromonospora echinofusca]
MGGRTRSLWFNRDFVLLWVGAAVSTAGTRVSSVAYPLLVLALTGSPAAAGAVGFAATLPYLVWQLPAGALADRWDRRLVMIWSDIGRCVAVGTVVVALLTDRMTVAHLAVVSFVEGTLYVFHSLAERGAVRNVVSTGQLPAALSSNEVRERAASFLGQSAGGFLFGLARWVPFLVDTVSYLLSLVTLLFIRRRFQTGTGTGHHALGTEIRQGLKWFWSHPFLRDSAVLVAGSNLFFQALTLLLVVRALDLGGSPGAVGVMLAVSGVGGIVGSFVAPRLMRLISLKLIVIGANWVWAALMASMILARDIVALGAIYTVMGFVGAVWNVAVSSYQLTVTPDAVLSRVTSVSRLLAFGAIPLGSLAGGFLLDAFGSAPVVLILAGGFGLLAVASVVMPGVRQVSEPPAPDAGVDGAALEPVTGAPDRT